MSNNKNENAYSKPDGLLGEIAQFIHDAAPMPIPEVALAASIGLMSGIAGRAYNISGTGLNTYTLLLAPTGVGKEGGRSGQHKVMKSVRLKVPAAEPIGPGEISSAQALKTELVRSPCFVAPVGEFGLALQSMTKSNAPAHLLALRRSLLDLYNQSGANDELTRTVYADKEKNTQSISSPAFSIYAESTPETFYGGLNASLINDGLVPRFSIIEYFGEAPARNKNPLVAPSNDLTGRLASLCAQALTLNHQRKVIDIACTADAEAELDAFDSYARQQRSGKDEVTRQLWSRAHMKVLKLASLVAVGRNSIAPKIELQDASWAIRLERASVGHMLARFESGDIGDTNKEDVRIRKVIHAFCAYLATQWQELPKSYDVKEHIHADKVVTFTYLHRRLCNTAHFKKDGYSEPTDILKRTLKTLMDRGDIQEVPRSQMAQRFNSTSVAYVLRTTKLLTEYVNEGR